MHILKKAGHNSHLQCSTHGGYSRVGYLWFNVLKFKVSINLKQNNSEQSLQCNNTSLSGKVKKSI